MQVTERPASSLTTARRTGPIAMPKPTSCTSPVSDISA
jgi:hypothetical protein